MQQGIKPSNILNINGMDEEIFRDLTTTVELDSTIPHIWSPRLEKTYRDILKLTQFAVVNNELLNAPGDEVEINRLNEIGMAADMEAVGPAGETPVNPETPWNAADTPYVETAFTTEQIALLRPSMKFKAVRFTKKSLVRSFVNVMGDATTALAYALAAKTEFDCFNAISSGTQLQQSVTDWTALVAGDVMDTDKIRDAKEVFDVAVKMNPIAYFPGESVVCFLHPHQYRDLTDDTKWFDIAIRQSPEAVYRGEVLMWDNVRFVKSTAVKYYSGAAGAAYTDVAGADMYPEGGTTPARKWYFSTLGTLATVRTNIVPRYQFNEYGHGAAALSIVLDATDVNAKITAINYRDGWVMFDVPVGGTADPAATFSWGTVAGYESIVIGARAFALANKQMPTIEREIRNYGLFIGLGAYNDYDVKRLNNEQIVKIWTAG